VNAENTDLAIRDLTPVERASNALSKAETEAELKALAEESKSIVTVTDPASREVCHQSMMTLKNMRLLVQKRAKKAREEAQEYSKTVISIEKELVALIEPEEARLAGIRDEWDSAKEREREVKVQAEISRVAQIQRFIDGIREWPLNAAGKSSSLVNQMLQSATDYEITEEVFQERTAEAKTVLMASTAALQGIYQERLNHEAEQQRLIAERQELAKLRAEAAERARIDAARLAQEEAAARLARDAENARQEAALTAQRELDRQAREAQAKTDRLAREEQNRLNAEAAANLAAEKAENDRLARERQDELDRQAESQRRTNAEEAGRLAAERQRFEQEQAERQRQESERIEAERKRAEAKKIKTIANVSDTDLIIAIASIYKTTEPKVIERLQRLNLNALAIAS
jgi:hypothetical protein